MVNQLKPYWSSPIATLYQADARVLPLPDSSVHCVVTSPPYWMLRDYGLGSEGIGLEPTLDEYLVNLVLVFREVRRVLRDDGVLWLNIGDGYGANFRWGGERTTSAKQRSNKGSQPFGGRNGSSDGQKLGVPERLVLALQGDGWLWRDTVVWVKPAPMPESVAGWRWERCRVKVGHRGRGREEQRIQTYPDRPQQDHDGRDFKSDTSWADCPGCPKCTPNDGLVLRRGSWRCTKSHEYIYMLAKGMHYYADGEAVRLPFAPATLTRLNESTFWEQTGGPRDYGQGINPSRSARKALENLEMGNLGGANRRSVWHDIAPEQHDSADGHFAAFPSDLPRLCIQASTSEAGCCPTCGTCWARVVEHEAVKMLRVGTWLMDGTPDGGWSGQRSSTITVGWRPTCLCLPHEAVPCVVLDPFAGTGTTLVAAQRLGRRSVGVELSEEYLALAVKRLTGEPLPLVMNRYEVAKSPGEYRRI